MLTIFEISYAHMNIKLISQKLKAVRKICITNINVYGPQLEVVVRSEQFVLVVDITNII
jgi:hypothetical protein